MSRFAQVAALLSIAAVLYSPNASAQGNPTPPLNISVQGAAVTASGLTPNGPVVILAGWWFSSQQGSNLTNTWRAGMADGSGSFSATLHLPVPEGALLIALDPASGRTAVFDVGTPRFRKMAIPENRLRRAANREVDEIGSPHDHALIVVMRAGAGVWVQNASDGGSTDDDARPDGVIRTSPGSMIPLAGSPAAPEKIKHKDVIVLLDGLAGIFASTEVAE